MRGITVGSRRTNSHTLRKREQVVMVIGFRKFDYGTYP
jgi:hypothetical protein